MNEIRRLGNIHPTITSVSIAPAGHEVACGTISTDIYFCSLVEDREPEALDRRGIVVEYSPDGTLIASAIDERLMVSVAETGKFIRQFDWHKNAVLDIAFSPEGRTIAAGGRDELLIIDIDTGMPVQRFDSGGIVSGIKYTPDGGRLVTSNQDSAVSVWNCSTAEMLYKLQGHSDRVRALDISKSGSFALSAGEDGFVLLWDIEHGKLVEKYDIGTTAWSIGLLPDNRHAVCGCNGSLILIDLLSGNLVSRHDEDVMGDFIVDILPNGTHAVTGSNDGSIRLWSLL